MAIDAPPAEQRRDRLREQRLALPDQPGVYLFRDARGRVVYVGKAKSIRKRVASHFSNPTVYGTTALTEEIDHIDYLVVVTESEALLTEQNFIKQYKPKFNIRLRDDKSYPYIAISLDEDFPRVYFTREKHKRGRAYFGPYSSAKRVRGTLDLLGKIFLFRSCEGSEPGRHSGSPCLDYFIKRCGAPCVGYVSREEYREGIDGVVAFLSGRFKQIEKDLERRMYLLGRRARLRAGDGRAQPAAGGQVAARAPAGGRGRRGDLRRGGRGRRGHRGQRAGLPGARRRPQRPPVLLPREPGRGRAGDRRRGVHAPVLRERAVDPAADRRAGRDGRGLRAGRARPAAGRAARGRGGDPRLRARRQAPDPRSRGAQRAARARPGEAEVRASPPAARRRADRPPAGARSPRAAGPDRVLRHLARRRHAHRRVDGRLRGRSAEEERLPSFHDPRGRHRR